MSKQPRRKSANLDPKFGKIIKELMFYYISETGKDLNQGATVERALRNEVERCRREREPINWQQTYTTVSQ